MAATPATPALPVPEGWPPDPLPARFGDCAVCAYRESGSSSLCFTCAVSELTSDQSRHCAVCRQPLSSGRSCPNEWCRREDRCFDSVWSIAPRAGPFDWALTRYKYQQHLGWAVIFGRVLVGFLDAHAKELSRFDRILGSPSYTGPGARRPWDHVGLVLEAAGSAAQGRWPFAPGAIRKTAETEAMTHAADRAARRRIAETQLRGALEVPDPRAIRGASILVVDDVFTEGSTLHEVARALLRAGAASVSGLALTRQPWRS